MTRIPGSLERHHTAPVLFPWLAVWQLTGGHAHGKVRAQVQSNGLQEIEATRTETGVQFRMTIRYGMPAAALFEAVQLYKTAAARCRDLCGVPD